jgi:hypothetical protein
VLPVIVGDNPGIYSPHALNPAEIKSLLNKPFKINMLIIEPVSTESLAREVHYGIVE